MVIAYRLAVYTGIPFTFLFNGWLLQPVCIRRLYSLGRLLSGVSMICLMSLHELSISGLAVAGLLMGLSFGLYWSKLAGQAPFCPEFGKTLWFLSVDH